MITLTRDLFDRIVKAKQAKMRKELQRIEAATLEDGDNEELLERIRIMAHRALHDGG